LELSEITDEIRSKGHWDVAIRPEPFIEDRVDYADLDEIMVRAVVRLRGWPVPYIDHREEPLRGDDWIGHDIGAEGGAHYEAWRFFTSGQFNRFSSRFGGDAGDRMARLSGRFVPAGGSRLLRTS